MSYDLVVYCFLQSALFFEITPRENIALRQSIHCSMLSVVFNIFPKLRKYFEIYKLRVDKFILYFKTDQIG